MNSADSMQSQDNINQMVSLEREYNLLPIDRVTDISVHREDQQITGKKTEVCVFQ